MDAVVVATARLDGDALAPLDGIGADIAVPSFIPYGFKVGLGDADEVFGGVQTLTEVAALDAHQLG